MDTHDTIKPISLGDIWNTLFRRKVMIAATIAIFIVLGFLFYELAPRQYSAKAVVLIENQQTDVQIKAVLTAEPNDLTMIPSEIQVLTSRGLMAKVIDKLGYATNPSLLSKKPDANAKAATLSKEELEARRNRLTDYLLSKLKVHQIEKSRAIEVKFDASNPQAAADIVNTLTNLYIEEQLNGNFDAIRMTNEWLASRVAETQKKVFEADTKVAEYRQKAGIVDSRGFDLIEQDMADLSNKLTAAKANIASTESRLNGIKDEKGLLTAPEILAAPLIQNLRERESEARNQVAALRNDLGPSHPKVLAAQAQANEISGKITQEINKLGDGLRAEHQAALENADNITKQLDTLKEEYNKYKASNVELAALESEALTNRAFLETLNLRYKETQSQQDNKFQTPYARIISEATVPDGPSSPNGPLILIAALVVGLGLGAGLALALDHVHHGVYNGKQLQEITGKTNVAVVPKEALKGLASYADFPVSQPFSPFMKSIRALSMFIRLEMGKNPSAKVFNFTSAAAGEGKSAVVVSTARQLALEGLRVLAIDCDVRQPTLTNTFGIMQKPGLNEVLKGQATLNDVMFRDSKTGATLIGVGKLDDVNVMSRALEDWKKLLDSVSSQFDIVLLDSPPVVSFPESKLLAKLSQNILCVRWRKTSYKLIGFTLDTLNRLDCAILGTVITMSESKHSQTKDSYRY